MTASCLRRAICFSRELPDYSLVILFPDRAGHFGRKQLCSFLFYQARGRTIAKRVVDSINQRDGDGAARLPWQRFATEGVRLGQTASAAYPGRTAGDLGRVTEELAYILASVGDRSAVDAKGLDY
jgi:hypothetical protein